VSTLRWLLYALRVLLRPNAKFWDGSPVTAQNVQNAFQANWAAYPAANGLLSKDTGSPTLAWGEPIA